MDDGERIVKGAHDTMTQRQIQTIAGRSEAFKQMEGVRSIRSRL